MRIATLIIASSLLVAAGGDNQPSSPVAARPSASASVVSADQPVKAAAGKGSGITFTTVVSPLAHMDGVNITARNALATCPTGSWATGGGYWMDFGERSARVQINAPTGGTTWRVLIADATEPVDFHAYVICATM
jgi:hypothetical protein